MSKHLTGTLSKSKSLGNNTNHHHHLTNGSSNNRMKPILQYSGKHWTHTTTLQERLAISLSEHSCRDLGTTNFGSAAQIGALQVRPLCRERDTTSNGCIPQVTGYACSAPNGPRDLTLNTSNGLVWSRSQKSITKPVTYQHTYTHTQTHGAKSPKTL